MSRITSIHEARTHLSRIVEDAASGAEVVIAKTGTPMAPDSSHRRPAPEEARVAQGPDHGARRLQRPVAGRPAQGLRGTLTVRVPLDTQLLHRALNAPSQGPSRACKLITKGAAYGLTQDATLARYGGIAVLV